MVKTPKKVFWGGLRLKYLLRRCLDPRELLFQAIVSIFLGLVFVSLGSLLEGDYVLLFPGFWKTKPNQGFP